MPAPTLTLAAERLYAQVEHLEVDQPELGYSVEAEGWPWATLCAALAAPVDRLYEILAVGARPWLHALDVDEAPGWILPFLGQFRGVVLPLGLSDADARSFIRRAEGVNRGGPDALRVAIEPLLTGERRVIVIERDGSAAAIRVRTYASETPAGNLALILDRLQRAKRWGLLLTHERVDLRTWASRTQTWAASTDTWAAGIVP